MRYRVGLRVWVDMTLVVDAKSEDEAEAKADKATVFLDLSDDVFSHVEAVDDLGFLSVEIDSVEADDVTHAID